MIFYSKHIYVVSFKQNLHFEKFLGNKMYEATSGSMWLRNVREILLTSARGLVVGSGSVLHLKPWGAVLRFSESVCLA